MAINLPTIEEWKAELAKLEESSGGEQHFSVEDMCGILGVGPGKARKILAKWIQEGKARVVMVMMTTLTGLRQRRPRYQMVRTSKTKK